MIFDIEDNGVITLEGGGQIDPYILSLYGKKNNGQEQIGGSMDPYVLETYGENPNDPNKISTHCKDKTGSISYERAKKRFEKYYDTLNKTDSGRMRGKMFDAKYNKKDRKLLYPGEPCSIKYLEPNGPSEYDMWGVDAFPEGTNIEINSQNSVISHYYRPGDKYADKLKYGPEITTTHLLNQYGEEGTKEFLDENYQDRLFNQYFKKIKPPKWPKREKSGKGIKRDVPIIEDDDSEQFQEAINETREKRSKKKTYAPMPTKFPIRKAQESPTIIQVDKPEIIENPADIIDTTQKVLEPQDIFYQPVYYEKAPRNSHIDTMEEWDDLVFNYSMEIPALFNTITRFLYPLPLKRDYLANQSSKEIEKMFNDNRALYFDLLEKPITPLAKITLLGIQYFSDN